MEGISRLVSESLARHGFDRPLDYRRLHWSRWFRCESHHSLLQVPSKPGVFALAEEIVNFAPSNAQVGTAVLGGPAEHSSVAAEPDPRRMLAVTQFFESDDMAFSLDRMLIQANPMRARLNSGRYFVRFVTIQEDAQRRSICASLNQWVANSGEKIAGIGAHFASSLDLNQLELSNVRVENDLRVGNNAHAPAGVPAAMAARTAAESPTAKTTAAISTATPHLDSGSATNLHCPSPLPSGF